MDVNKLKREAQKLQGKAETFLKDHHDQLESGVTKAETFAKSKAKTPKRDAQINKVAGRLRDLLPSDEPKPGPKPQHPEGPGTPSA